MGRWICGRWICVWGTPHCCLQSLRNRSKERFWEPLDWKSGRPKNADSTTTDPTPHSRPSDYACFNGIFGWLFKNNLRKLPWFSRQQKISPKRFLGPCIAKLLLCILSCVGEGGLGAADASTCPRVVGQRLETPKSAIAIEWRSNTIETSSLDGGNSALVIGLQSRPILRPQNHYFWRHFGASKRFLWLLCVPL